MSFSKSAWLKGDDDESEDDEIQDEQIRDRPDAIVYLIDVSPSMLESSADPDEQETGRQRSNVSTALKSALDLMKTRIISGSPRDVVGVVLYNTVKTRNVEGEMPKEGLYMLVEPSTMRAANIKALSDIVEEAESSPKSFEHKFAPIDTDVKPTQLIEGMRFAENLLKNRSSNISNRSLYVITDNDDPFQGNQQQQRVALVFANDAHESGFSIKTFFMPADAKNFDLTRFWNRFRYDPSVDAEMDNASMVFSGEKRFTKLLSLSSESGKSKRSMFSIPFFLAEGVAMSVTGYAAVGEQRKKPPVQVDQADEIREVYYKTQYTDQNTGEDLDAKTEIVKYMRLGDKGPNEQRIFFDSEEITKMKNLGMSPSLKLLGFMPRDQMKPQYTLKHSYLIYPNEALYANSIPAFSALLKSMLKKGVVGLGVLVARSNSTPQFVHLLPQGEERDEETDVQTAPPCIWLVQIPFADDIRPPVRNSSLSVKESLNDAAPLVQSFKKLIKKLKVEYAPHQFANPSLQYHYANLEAIALQLDTPDPKDETVPMTDLMTDRIASAVKEIKSNLEDHPKLTSYVSSGNVNSGSAGNGGGSDGEGPATKKVKVSDKKASMDIGKLEKKLVDAIEKGTLAKVTNDTLKDYLKQKDVKKFAGKKKAELIEMVMEQLTADKLL